MKQRQFYDVVSHVSGTVGLSHVGYFLKRATSWLKLSTHCDQLIIYEYFREKRDFVSLRFCHYNRTDWCIDLFSCTAARVFNKRTYLRLNCCVALAFRLDNFVVGLTNDDPATTVPVYKSSYTLCAQFSGSVAASDSATVVCSPSSQRFRYVIVQGSHTNHQAMCLPEVKVYASE